jgi:hypothetical protein
MGDLRAENTQLRSQLDATILRMNQCDQELAHASEQQISLSKEVSNISSTKKDLGLAQTQNKILKGDLSRLLRLLEYSPATKGFFGQWQDSGGMHFVGIDHTSARAKDATYSAMPPFEQTQDAEFDETVMTPSELAHLKRVHGGDPFPMTETLQVIEILVLFLPYIYLFSIFHHSY